MILCPVVLISRKYNCLIRNTGGKHKWALCYKTEQDNLQDTDKKIYNTLFLNKHN